MQQKLEMQYGGGQVGPATQPRRPPLQPAQSQSASRAVSMAGGVNGQSALITSHQMPSFHDFHVSSGGSSRITSNSSSQLPPSLRRKNTEYNKHTDIQSINWSQSQQQLNRSGTQSTVRSKPPPPIPMMSQSQMSLAKPTGSLDSVTEQFRKVSSNQQAKGDLQRKPSQYGESGGWKQGYEAATGGFRMLDSTQ